MELIDAKDANESASESSTSDSNNLESETTFSLLETTHGAELEVEQVTVPEILSAGQVPAELTFALDMTHGAELEEEQEEE